MRERSGTSARTSICAPRVAGVVVVVWALQGLGGDSAIAAERTTLLPSETCRGLFVVPVTVGSGDGNTLELLLDTGSSWTFVDPGALRRVSGDAVRAGKATFPSARIASHELGPLKAYVLSMEALSLAVGRQLDGILGFPAFRDVLLTLDYPAQEVRVARGTLPPPDGREVFPAPGKRPHLVVEIGGRRFKLQVDSGYTGRFQLKASDRVAWAVAPRPVSRAVVVGGVVVTEGGRLDGAVRVGALEFRDPIVMLGGRERQVGWHVLRHFVLTFDQKTRRVRIRTERTDAVRMPPLTGTGLVDAPGQEGLKVRRVFPGSAAEAAGLREGDLIVAIDGVPVHERGCTQPAPPAAGRRHVYSYVRDGRRSETEVETRILVP